MNISLKQLEGFLPFRLRYWLARRRFDKARERVKTWYEEAKKKLDESADGANRRALEGEYVDRLRDIDADESTLWTKYLLSRAAKYRVPVPPKYDGRNELTDDWTRGPFHARIYLTRKGESELRQRIREEKEWRMKQRRHWVSTITGLIGAFTGLLAVYFSLR